MTCRDRTTMEADFRAQHDVGASGSAESGGGKVPAWLPQLLGVALTCTGVAWASLGWGGVSLAQEADMTFEADEGGDGSDMDFTAEGGEEGEAEAGSDMDFTAESGPGDDVIGDLASSSEVDTEGAAEGSGDTYVAQEEVYAVQQIYALRINRVELLPSYAITLNDPFVGHSAVSLGVNYWWTNVLALGLNFLWYEGLENESDLNFFVRRSTRLAVPISQYQLGAHLNFTYVPLYGKFAMFNEFIFQWDMYVVGGLGLMRTRPIPVVDPDVRNFDYDFRVAFNLGLGIRIFITRWLAVFGELRNYMYLEQLEALDVALGPERFNPDTWTQDGPAFTSSVTVHLGLSLFFPFEFDYNLPR